MASSKKIGKSHASKSQGMVLWLGMALLVLVLDQFTKVLVLGAFQLGDSTPITSFFNLVRVHNHGAAFSFLAGAGGWQRWFFTGIGVAAAEWLIARNPMLLGADNWPVEQSPSATMPGASLPVHQIALVVHGVHLLENMNLAEIVASGRNEFCFMMQPLRATIATAMYPLQWAGRVEANSPER